MHAEEGRSGSRPRGGLRKALFLLIPWLFLSVLTYFAWRVIVPAVQHGALYGYVLALLLVMVGFSFILAAVTMSRDVLAGRYP